MVKHFYATPSNQRFEKSQKLGCWSFQNFPGTRAVANKTAGVNLGSFFFGASNKKLGGPPVVTHFACPPGGRRGVGVGVVVPPALTCLFIPSMKLEAPLWPFDLKLWVPQCNACGTVHRVGLVAWGLFRTPCPVPLPCLSLWDGARQRGTRAIAPSPFVPPHGGYDSEWPCPK